MRRGRARGLTIMEFVVAMTLTVMLLAVSASALGVIQQSLGADRARDAALRIAQDTLAQADTLGCGLGAGVDDAPDTLDPATGKVTQVVGLPDSSFPAGVGDQVLDQRCQSLLPSGATLIGTYTANTAAWTQASATTGALQFTVKFRSEWQSADGEACDPTAEPTIAARTVVVSWTIRGAGKQVSVSDTQALNPALAAAASDGGVVVDTTGLPADTAVTLSGPGLRSVVRTTPLTATAPQTSGSYPTQCVWFPFLPTGTTVTASAPGHPYPTPATVQAGVFDEVIA